MAVSTQAAACQVTQVTFRAVSALVLLCATQTHALPMLSWRAEFQPTYVDNLFEYSPADLDSFVRGVNPARYPVRSADDIDLNIGMACLLRYTLGVRPGSVGIRTRLHGFLSNPEKSYGLATLEIEQMAWTGGGVSLSYLFLPDYLVRNYRPAGISRYEPCRFTEHLFSARVSQQFGRLDAFMRVRRQFDDYAGSFDYYDTRAWRLGSGIDWRVLDNIRVQAQYEYKTADAAGPVPDISYRQNGVDISIETRPMRFDRFGAVLSYGFARRRFTTRNPASVDPAHAGRVDDISRAGVELRYRHAGVTFSLGYEAEWRQLLSASSYQIDEVKEYRKNSFSLGIVLSGRSR